MPTARTEKRRREIASVLTDLTTPELEIEMLRRAVIRTQIEIICQTEALRILKVKSLDQTAEIARQQVLLEGGAC